MVIEIKNVRCPVCTFADSKHYLSKSFKDMSASWFRCRECGTLFLSPLPTQQELAEYYRKNYAERTSPGTVSHRFRFNTENKNVVFNEYQLSLSDIGISNEMLHNKNILDYGCANGFFLDFCFENGTLKKNLFGYDIAEDLLNDVRKRGYNILNDEKKKFDYIFLWDVLEHIPKPKDFLLDVKLYLKWGGEIIVQTPRVGILSDSFKNEWQHFLPFEHVILYTRESLVELFDDVGFQLLKTSSFGSNSPSHIIPEPYKSTFDCLAKFTDNGSTQVARFILKD